MPYVERGLDGQIKGKYGQLQPGYAEEYLDDGDAELQPSLDEIKTKKWSDIKAERDRRKFGGVFVSDKWIHSDTFSRTQWMAMMIMGASVPPEQWSTMDGTAITISQSLVGQVFQAIATLDAISFANAKAHRAALEISADPSTYDFSAGWPAIFGE